MINQAEADLRERIRILSNETIELRDWLERRRDIVKSTAEKLRLAEGRLAVLRQQLADYQMAQKAAKERVEGVEPAQLRWPDAVSVEIARM